MGIYLFIFGVVYAYGKTPAGKAGGIVFVIFGMLHPGLKLDRLGRAIHRPVRHNQGFGLAVCLVIIAGIPDI